MGSELFKSMVDAMGMLTYVSTYDYVRCPVHLTSAVCRPELVADGVIRLVEEDQHAGAVMRITPQKGIEVLNMDGPKSKL